MPAAEAMQAEAKQAPDERQANDRQANERKESQMSDISGKAAVVTGGSRGIGRAIAIALARAGCNVAVNYVRNNAEALSCVAEIERLGRRATAVRADVSVEADAKRLADEARSALGPVSVLVNNAGIGRRHDIADISLSDWQETLNANLTSAFLVTRALLPDMRVQRFGRIVNIASVAAQTGGVIGPHYAASKAGLLGLTRSLAATLAAEGITANAVAPGPIETEMLRANPSLAVPGRIPVGRLGTAEEVAEITVALLGNGFITGQTVGVNGGIYPA
jgi:3-oxoacyl-[acyl-carrier protein] reductase